MIVLVAGRTQAQPPEAADQVWTAGYNAGGGGFYVQNGDRSVDIRVLGYVQSLATVFDRSALPVKFTTLDFNVRRARLDFLATFLHDYTLFLELDAAPVARTAMVEAYINAKLSADVLQVRAGKFIVPFSTENLRSSRAYDEVERYLALNSMFVLPGLDTQYGLMFWGTSGGATPVTYWLGVFNGNGSANANTRENNIAKEVVAKVRFKPSAAWEFSAAFDNTTESGQRLKLTDYSFTDYLAVDVTGPRTGYNADVFYESGPFSFRAEGLVMSFADVHYQLRGGFLQPAFFLTGDARQGFQPLFRFDYADIHGTGGAGTASLRTYMLGFQWFMNPNLRLQFNYGLTAAGGAGNQPAYAKNSELRHILLTELQLKF
jgi:phosphate-selective porin